MLTPASTDAVNRAPRTSYSEATRITQAARNFGASLGLAVLGTVLIHRVDTNVTCDTKVVIFGSPQAGTPVMQASPLAALDLPLKVLVWLDQHQTKLSYTAPHALAIRYDPSEELGNRLTGIDAITDAVIDR
jgi:uncharacterized protein (DUF302 family)